jgi:hypothetical protein
LVTGRLMSWPLGPDLETGAVKGMGSVLGVGAVKEMESDLEAGAVKAGAVDSNVAASAAMPRAAFQLERGSLLHTGHVRIWHIAEKSQESASSVHAASSSCLLLFYLSTERRI